MIIEAQQSLSALVLSGLLGLVMHWLSEIVTDSNGKTSSKRVAFIGAFIVASIVLLVGAYHNNINADAFEVYIMAFAAVGAAGVLEKKHIKE